MHNMRFVYVLGFVLSMQALGLRMHTSTSKAAILAELREEATRTIMASILGAEPDWSSFIEKSQQLTTGGKNQLSLSRRRRPRNNGGGGAPPSPCLPGTQCPPGCQQFLINNIPCCPDPQCLINNIPRQFFPLTRGPPPNLPQAGPPHLQLNLGLSLVEIGKACRHAEHLLRVALNDTSVVPLDTSPLNLVATSATVAANSAQHLLDEVSNTKEGTVSLVDRVILLGTRIPLLRLLAPSLTVDVHRACNQLTHAAGIDVKVGANENDFATNAEQIRDALQWQAATTRDKAAQAVMQECLDFPNGRNGLGPPPPCR